MKEIIVLKILLVLLNVAFFSSISLISTQLHTKYFYHIGAAVVRMTNGMGSGTGFQVLTPNGNKVLVTNNHICEMADDNDDLLVEHDGATYLTHVIKRSKVVDVCILTPVESIPTLSIGSEPEIGDIIYLFGHPLGEGAQLTVGNYVGYDKSHPMARGLKMDVTSMHVQFVSVINYPGNSGSPVMNSFGNVIGVFFASRGSLGRMIPVSYLVELIKNL